MRRTKYLNADEVCQLMDYARHQHPLVWMVVDFALSTGLRSCEMARCRVEDFDFQRCLLAIIRAKRRARRQDEIAIPQSLKEHLLAYLDARETGPLFIGQRGPLSAQGLQLIWRRAVSRAGLPRYSIHAARHTLAVHLLRKTGNLRMVQKQLGHASPATTANMYADVSFEDMQGGLNGLYA